MSGNVSGSVHRVTTTGDGQQLVIVKVKRQTYGLKVPATLTMREGQNVSLKIEHGQAVLA